MVFDVAFAEIFATEVRKVVVGGRLNDAVGLRLAIPVHDDIVGDAHEPCGELSASGVAACLQLRDDFHERLLEDIVSQIAVVHHEEDVRIQL